MAKYSFHSKVPAKCYYSEIIYQYAPVLELNFLKIKFQCKTRFVENQVIGNQTLKNKKNNNNKKNYGTQIRGTRVSFKIFQGTQVPY